MESGSGVEAPGRKSVLWWLCCGGQSKGSVVTSFSFGGALAKGALPPEGAGALGIPTSKLISPLGPALLGREKELLLFTSALPSINPTRFGGLDGTSQKGWSGKGGS